MYLHRLPLSLPLLLCLIALGRSEPQCQFSIPGLLKSSETSKGCLNVKRHTAPVNVNVVLEVNDENVTIISEVIPAVDTFKCYAFQVPQLKRPAPVFITLNATSTDYEYVDRRSVVIAPTEPITLIQTDKYMYKPGQTVNMNVISITNDMRPVDMEFPVIFVSNSAGNRLFQWMNEKTENGFKHLTFKLNEDQALGSYTITVQRAGQSDVIKQIMVDEYILPKIRVDIEAPGSITILDTTVPIKLIATYTYGQGVLGKVSGRVCRKPNNYYYGRSCNRNADGLCVTITGETDVNGTFSTELDLIAFQLDRSGYTMGLSLQMTLTEGGTEIQVTESKYIGITSQMGRVYFTDKNGPSFYKKGIPLPTEVKVEDGLGNPMKNQTVEIQVNGVTVQNLTTDEDGKAQYDIDTSGFTQPDVQIQVNYKTTEACYDSGYIVPSFSNDARTINRFYSRTGSFVQIQRPKEELQCGQRYDINVLLSFGETALEDGETTASFIYLVMAKSNIVTQGEKPVDLSNSLQGNFTVSLDMSYSLAPSVDLVVYYMLKSEVIGDTVHINTEKCLENQVSLTFSEREGTPGSSVNLNINSAANSLCAIRGFDSSLLLLNQDKGITRESVYSYLQYMYLSSYYIAGYNIAPPTPPCIEAKDVIMIAGMYYTPVGYLQEGDTDQMFTNCGLVFFTQTQYRKPSVCGSSYFPNRGFETFAFGASSDMVFSTRPEMLFTSAFARGDSGFAAAPEITTVRKNFPEVWFFKNMPVGESGVASVPMTVPDTITEWKSDIICLSRQCGLGISKYLANFTAKQPIFLEYTIPDNMVRGETLDLRVVVFNNWGKCVQVRANVAQSEDFTVEPVDGDEVKCLCSGRTASFYWKMTPNKVDELVINVTAEAVPIGDSCDGDPDPNQPSWKDTVIKNINVEAEGIQKQATYSNFVCVNGTNSVIPVSISLPENAVEGSVKATVIVIGDILGRALTNPESMIREPTGCGEQNLATLIALPLVMNYLNVTNRLTDEIRHKAIENMGIGYRRQLQYRTYDGSFSAFGGIPGSSWLTVKTFQAFSLINEYMPVDQTVFNQMLLYLETLQDLNTGSFKPRGTLFNNALKGGAEDDVSFTAAVCITLMETNYPASPTLIRKALTFLDAASRRDQSVYNLAMLYLVFTMAGNAERSNAMFQILKALEIAEGGTVHWERPIKPEKQKSIFSTPAPSSEIEITATVMYAMSLNPKPSEDDRTYMSGMALWMSQQQNSFGSYCTTADLVMSLQAMCGYGIIVHRRDASNMVQLNHGGELVKTFNLDGPNRVLIQSQALSDIPGEYELNVSGNGCVLVQTAVQYNVPVSQENAAFSLTVTTLPKSCVNGVAYSVPVSINVSYDGILKKSNMVLIDITLLSGYSVEHQSLVQLRNQVPKVEQKSNRFIIYLDSLTAKTVSLSVTLEMTNRVYGFQPRSVLVCDYYEPDENGAAELRHPCSLQ